MKSKAIRQLLHRLATTSSIALLAATAAGSAYAAPNNLVFELDSSANLRSDGKVDWADLYDVAGPTAEPTPKNSNSTPPLPVNFSTPSFSRDFQTTSNADTSTFATGSKDTLDISGWQCGKSNNVNEKVNLLNSYAVPYVDPVTRHTIIYFGLETASNEGTRNAAFWFLKDGTVACEANGGKNVTFTGLHQDGDILIAAEYTGGGGVSLINVYVWDGGALTPLTSGTDCSNAGPGDSVCGTTNRTALLGSAVPWLTKTKTANPSVPTLQSTDLDKGELFEGGINLTVLGLSACFGKFLANTRSSATETATLFDFTVGKFASCKISVSKSCDVRRVATEAERMTNGGKNFLVNFIGAVTNAGGGTLPKGTPVNVVDDAGTPGVTTDDKAISLTVGDDGLAPGGLLHFMGSFFTNLNPPTNTVTATAIVSETVINADPFSIECNPLVLRSALTVTKDCGIPATANAPARPGTELIQQDGLLVVRVNASGQVCYADPQMTANVPYLDVSAGNQLGTNPVVGQLGSAITLSKSRLLPGDCADYTVSYTPSRADGPTSPASDGTFTDTVSARGTHPALSVEQRPFASDPANCPICPCTGSGCPPPPP